LQTGQADGLCIAAFFIDFFGLDDVELPVGQFQGIGFGFCHAGVQAKYVDVALAGKVAVGVLIFTAGFGDTEGTRFGFFFFVGLPGMTVGCFLYFDVLIPVIDIVKGPGADVVGFCSAKGLCYEVFGDFVLQIKTVAVMPAPEIIYVEADRIAGVGKGFGAGEFLYSFECMVFI